jgi:hypothetical protein
LILPVSAEIKVANNGGETQKAKLFSITWPGRPFFGAASAWCDLALLKKVQLKRVKSGIDLRSHRLPESCAREY